MITIAEVEGMSRAPQLKDWREVLERQIDNFSQRETELLALIRLCEETLYDMEPAYIYVRDQRGVIQDWREGYRRLYITRFGKEPPILSREELQSEEVLDSTERRKTEVRRMALELTGNPGEEITDQAVLDALTASGRRFIAENPKATVSTILNGFKSKFEKVEGTRGVFKRRASEEQDTEA